MMNKARKVDWKNTGFVVIICFLIFISWQPISSAADFDAEVQDIWLYPSEINQGDSADVKIKVMNLADPDNGYNGYGTYDIRIRIWKPGGGYDEYPWNNYELSNHQVKTFKKSNYLFDESGTYTIKGEVYDINGYESGWDTSHRFNSKTEYFDAVPKGNLRVRCYEHDGSSLEADTIIVYDGSGEVDRTYDKNSYTFTDLDEDVYYVEIYEMNNLVDLETGISVEGGQTRTVDMYANEQVTLDVYAYYNDHTTPYPTADVRIMSWDGYNSEWDTELNYQSLGSDGHRSFDLYPTTQSGEKFRIVVFETGHINDVAHDEEFTITGDDTISAYFDETPPVPKGNLRVRCYEHDGSSLEADTIIVYDGSGEVDRTYDKNSYTFTDLDEDVYYVEIYEMNNLVDLETGISVEGGQTRTVDMYANEQVTLDVYAYYNRLVAK